MQRPIYPMQRPIFEIAEEISSNWEKPYFGAKPYLEAMHTLVDMESRYYAEDAKGIILYFLANASTWKGETARRIKAELKSIIK
jgi:hypothetical protein